MLPAKWQPFHLGHIVLKGGSVVNGWYPLTVIRKILTCDIYDVCYFLSKCLFYPVNTPAEILCCFTGVTPHVIFVTLQTWSTQVFSFFSWNI